MNVLTEVLATMASKGIGYTPYQTVQSTMKGVIS